MQVAVPRENIAELMDGVLLNIGPWSWRGSTNAGMESLRQRTPGDGVVAGRHCECRSVR